MATLLTPNDTLTKAAVVVAIGTDTSVYVGRCRLVGAWVHHSATALLSVYDSTSTSTGFKFSIRNASTNMAAVQLSNPAGITFETGIHGNATVTSAAFVAYVPL